jgi:hypothetical protein
MRIPGSNRAGLYAGFWWRQPGPWLTWSRHHRRGFARTFLQNSINLGLNLITAPDGGLIAYTRRRVMEAAKA